MKWLVLLAVLAGCPTPTSGTISLGLTTAPGSTLLDNITHLRVTLTNPRQVVEADRTPTGFAITLDVEANGEPGAIVVEGFDANGGLVAAGQSPEFGVAAVDARIVVYMNVPLEIGAAPVSLDRKHISSAPLTTYGALFAGGRNADDTPSDAIAIYNAYDHTLTGGKAMPAPRDGIVVAPGSNGAVFLYGGVDAGSNETGTYWLFDTRPSPGGAYIDLGDHPGLTRAAATAIPVGVDRFVLTGAPPIDLQGQNVNARGDVAALTNGASTFKGTTHTALALDADGNIVRFVNNAVDSISVTPHPGATITSLPDGRFIVVGGTATDHDLIVIDGTTGIANALTTVLPHPTAIVAATKRHVLLITPPSIEILDGTSLGSIGMRDAPQNATTAIALPNDQVLILSEGGGLSLFTPPPPAL